MAHCERCERYFSSWRSYEQHIEHSSMHNFCDDCDLDFPSYEGLRQHWVQSSRHHFCRECDTHFSNRQRLIKHCFDAHYYCGSCDRFFKNAYGLQEHNRQTHHLCVDCDLFFQSENNLREHLRSRIHRPLNVACAFANRGCREMFVSASAMIQHLETGTCTSGVDRERINEWVRKKDRGGDITVPPRSLTDGGRTTRLIATERSWNGTVYECVLCPRKFLTLDDLNRHLASPKHEQKIYHCPLSTCYTRFTTLSGLVRHVESEKCGVSRFKAVREGMDALLDRMPRLRLQDE